MMKTGYVYKLCCNDINVKEIYVGSTVNMKERRREHRHRCNNPNHPKAKYKVYECIRANGGFNNWSMIQLEKVEFADKHQLHAKERFYLEQLQATLNAYIPTRTNKEYYDEHKERIKQNKKEHYDKHKEHYLQYKQQYYETHNEQIKAYANIINECPCGNSYTNQNKSRHMKTKKHIKGLANAV
jgi:hypothetical protein